jgi:hypothetical protein
MTFGYFPRQFLLLQEKKLYFTALRKFSPPTPG